VITKVTLLVLAATRFDTKCATIYPTDFCHHFCPDFHYCESAGLNVFKTET